VLLEMADACKRDNRWEEARKLFSAACEAQPLAAQAWLEWAKMEEERGLLRKAGKILRLGLRFCEVRADGHELGGVFLCVLSSTCS